MPNIKESIKLKTKIRGKLKNNAVNPEGVGWIRNRFSFCTNQISIIIGSFIFGIIIWVADSIIDYLTIPNISFINSIAGDIPGHEIYMRTFVLSCFLVFGFIAARMIKKIIESKNDLRESEVKYRSFIEGPNAILIFEGKTLQIIDANQAALELYGYSRKEFLNLRVTDISAEKNNTEKFVEKVRNGDLRKASIGHHRKKDGTIFTVEISPSDFILKGHKVLCGIIRDITERVQFKERIQEKARTNQLLLDAFPCIALLLRSNSREIVASNKAAREIGAIPGKTCFESWAQQKDPCPWCLAPDVWADDKPKHCEPAYNDIIWDAHWIPISDDLYIHFAFDITKRKQMEKELKAANDTLEEKVIERTASLEKTNDLLKQKVIENEEVHKALAKSEELHRVTLSNISDAVYITDDNGNFTFICLNENVLFGYSKNEVESMTNISELLGDNLFDMAELNNKNEIANIEREVFDKKGQKHDILVNVKKVSIGNGTILYSYHDITERKQVEEELKKSEERYRSIFETAASLMTSVNHEGIIVDCNARIEKFLGYSREEIIGQSMAKIIAPEYLEKAETSLAEIFEKGYSESKEYKMIHKNGNQIDVVINCSGLKDFEGNYERTICIIDDVTARRRVEEEVIEKQRQMDSLLSNIDAIVLEGDPFNIYYVGGRVEKILGYSIDDWFADSEGPVGFWTKHLHPDDKDKIRICAEAIARGENNSFEYRMIAADGKTVWFYDSVSVETENGIPIKARSVMIDITKRKLTEYALQESERKFKYLFENALVSVAISDVDGKTVLGNEIMHKMFGYSKQEMQDLKAKELYKNPADRDNFVDALKKNGQVENREIEYIKKNGQTFWAMMTAKFIMFEGKKAILSTGIDITDRKNAGIKFEETHSNLISEQIKLKSKNTALNEVLSQIENDKKRVAFQIRSNIDKIIMPILRRLDAKVGPTEKNDILLLQSSLEQVTIPFVSELEALYGRLTPREVEVCNMIKGGLSSKEIASSLNTSWETVRNQRKHVRKKLGITGEKTSLSSFLKAT